MKFIVQSIFFIVAISLIGSQTAWCMSSTNYSINWLLPMTGGGTKNSASSNYSMMVTYGQTVTGQSSSSNNTVQFGFWGGTNAVSEIFPWILFYPAFTGLKRR